MADKATEFIKEIIEEAKKIEEHTGIPHVALIAQAALESSWGKKRVGDYNLFGIKWRGSGKYVNVLTTEYSERFDAYDDYVSMKKVGNKYRFKVYQKFADYDSIEDCLWAYSELLLTWRYKPSLRWRYSPKRYLIALWRAGYATDPNYGYKILGAKRGDTQYHSVVDSVTRRLNKL